MSTSGTHSAFKVRNLPQAESYGGRLLTTSGSGVTIILSTGYNTAWCRTNSHVLICLTSGFTGLQPRATIPTNGTIRFLVGRSGSSPIYTWFVFAGGTVLGPA